MKAFIYAQHMKTNRVRVLSYSTSGATEVLSQGS